MPVPVVISTGVLATRMGAASSASGFLARMGIGNKIGDAIRFAKANPTAFALSAKELYDQGEVLAVALFSDEELGPQLQALLDGISHKADPIDLKQISELSRYTDELKLIKEASAYLGGTDRLLVLRKALALPDEYYHLQNIVKQLR